MTVQDNTTSLGGVDVDNRGNEVRLRRERLGMSKADLAKRAQVDRGKLQRFEEGKDSPSDRWVGGVMRVLDDFEEETGHDERPEPLRFTFRDIYGVGELIVEGPVDRPDELIESVAKLLAQIRNEQQS